MGERPRFNRLDWKGRGYFAFPIPAEEKKPAGRTDAHLWSDFEAALEQAKRGNFQPIPRLLELYDDAESWIIAKCYITLLGDAGPHACFQKLLEAFNQQLSPVYEAEFCEALATWGQLSIVPTLLDVLEERRDFQDMEILPEMLSWMVEKAPGEIVTLPDASSPDEYSSRVMQRYQELKQRLGTDQILVFRSDMFSVRGLARYIVECAEAGELDPYVRRRFEASTGIDCSAFFKEEVFQPLAAAALAEQFLNSPAADRYKDGARYFFGHVIPD